MLRYELRSTRPFILLAFSRSPLPGLPKDAFETRAEAWGSKSHVPSRPCYPNLQPLADLRGDGKPGGALRLPGAVREPPCDGRGGGGEGLIRSPSPLPCSSGPKFGGGLCPHPRGFGGGGLKARQRLPSSDFGRSRRVLLRRGINRRVAERPVM